MRVTIIPPTKEPIKKSLPAPVSLKPEQIIQVAGGVAASSGGRGGTIGKTLVDRVRV